MHREALTQEGLKLLPHLCFKGFILGGGTGIAIQIGHRVSEDFDFFSEKEIAGGLLGELEKVFAGFGQSVRPVVNNKDELTVFAGDTKITFLHYPFPTLCAPVLIGESPVFDIKEIAAMKAYALGRRGTMKDYVDLYFILQNGVTLQSIAEFAEKKYGDAFDARLFLEQIVYLEDVEDMPVRFLRKALQKEELRGFFENQVKKFPIS